MARTDSSDVWTRLAEPLESRVPPADGAHGSLLEPAQEGCSNAELARMRLDTIVPGGWELHVELLPVAETSRFVVKTRLVILGVAREDFGEGYSLSSASDDGLARAARRFGIGVEPTAATATPSVPVSMGVADTPAVLSADEELAAVFRSEPVKRKQQVARAAASEVSEASASPVAVAAPSAARKSTPKTRKDSEQRATISADEEFPSCPRCGDIMWDDRGAKKSADAPDFRCRRRGCVGTLWVDRSDAQATTPAASPSAETRDEEYPF